MIKTIFLVPVRDNEGRRFTRPAWQALDRRLAAAFGGLSIRFGVVGTWQADEHTYRDTSREYTVSLATWRQLAAWLAIVDWACERFGQEATYVEVAGIPEVLSRP
ncbi:MAG TPA: hypothetical protein VII06_24755 [Chloroflexota bacterium]|jgi:hypothetical protein